MPGAWPPTCFAKASSLLRKHTHDQNANGDVIENVHRVALQRDQLSESGKTRKLQLTRSLMLGSKSVSTSTWHRGDSRNAASLRPGRPNSPMMGPLVTQ